MHALNGEEMLVAWEHARQRPEQEAALALLGIAWPERSAGELAILPLSERNALLLELRASTMGPQMEGRALCPACGLELEFVLDAWKLAQALREPMTEDFEGSGDFTMRPANTQDLLACAEVASDEEARILLLERTVRLNNRGPNRAEEKQVGTQERAIDPAPGDRCRNDGPLRKNKRRGRDPGASPVRRL